MSVMWKHSVASSMFKLRMIRYDDKAVSALVVCIS